MLTWTTRKGDPLS
ncbi:hypothetical protein E2C01_064402 [Portunus trituberculatus]|uniref:Uncharacterized protein n=1 Tax=Portunus trituberculatus TaxID=210409 RepID=A0A5B7HIZ8_PORTR|nr:hypothetical protein [Portunus trituberculatus]